MDYLKKNPHKRKEKICNKGCLYCNKKKDTLNPDIYIDKINYMKNSSTSPQENIEMEVERQQTRQPSLEAIVTTNSITEFSRSQANNEEAVFEEAALDALNIPNKVLQAMREKVKTIQLEPNEDTKHETEIMQTQVLLEKYDIAIAIWRKDINHKENHWDIRWSKPTLPGNIAYIAITVEVDEYGKMETIVQSLKKDSKMPKQALKLYEDLMGIEEKIESQQHEANLKILCWNIKSIRRPLVRQILIEKC